MKRRVGIAVAGAVLAAGMVGGVGFGATGGRNGTNGTRTNRTVTSGDPAAAAAAIRCTNIQLEIVQTQLQIASARNPHQIRALTKKIVRLQQEYQRCITP